MTALSRRSFLAMAASTTMLAGCADTAADTAPVVSTPSPAPPPTNPAPPTPRRTPKPPPAAVHANKLGLIPVLMHHRLVTGHAGTYDMTPAYFRAELARLHRENYHPVRAIDLVRRDLAAVPAGKTPVVLTFDDSTPGQVTFDAKGRVTPDCALGILQSFHAAHPDFPAVATFYLNRNPFGLTGAAVASALVRLNALGCELGNHTWSHPNLHTLTRAQAEAEIGKLAALIHQAIPGTPASTIALPLGVHPRDSSVLAVGPAVRRTGISVSCWSEPTHATHRSTPTSTRWQSLASAAAPTTANSNSPTGSTNSQPIPSRSMLPPARSHPRRRSAVSTATSTRAVMPGTSMGRRPAT
ncbi:polysaccharide deacetylase family protein [Kribbella sp. NPDC051620]|uniref:polysaccharide deacetylase family protein n=1 Tax=Kribbella sp. NPDC051620 TaxID=3364120 RepID=UPI0037A00A27